ncbi:MAG: hypothetical protein JNN16_16825 [Nitrospira sp.]|nr:hypothetical protein [Nitrospira sp.]
MTKMVNGSYADIVRLTKAAQAAAEQGRWGEVIQCYSERGLLLASTPASTLPIEELLKMDGELRDRIQTAQAVLEDLLVEAQVTKRRVQVLGQRLGIPPSPPEAVSIEA